MRKFFLSILAVACCLAAFAADLDGKIKINIILKEQSDATELSRMADVLATKAERRLFVVNALKRQAKETQYDLLEYLDNNLLA